MTEDDYQKEVKSGQTRLDNDETTKDTSREIDEVCNLIPDKDVRLCAYHIFKLANKSPDRKLSTVDVLNMIVRATGKHHRPTLNDILRRMERAYRICVKCELGHSLIVNEPNVVKKFLLDGRLEGDGKQDR